MRRLRSPWTVLALVPAFFLAGFGIVSALADSPEPRVGGAAEVVGEETGGETATGGVPPPAAGGPAGADSATGDGGSPASDAATTTASGAGGGGSTTTGGPTTTGSDGDGGKNDGDGGGKGGNGNGGGGKGGGKAPPPGEVVVDYGRWKGVFRITKTTLVHELVSGTVVGRFRYLGGAGCKVGNVEVRGLFYDDEDVPVGQAFWESEWQTGAGVALTRKPLPLEAYGLVRHDFESAALRIGAVTCL